MKKYFKHIQNKPPHERRQHAVQVAGVCTSLVFVAWVTTLGMHLAHQSAAVTGAGGDSQVANASSIYDKPDNTLEVATTTDSQSFTLPYAQ